MKLGALVNSSLVGLSLLVCSVFSLPQFSDVSLLCSLGEQSGGCSQQQNESNSARHAFLNWQNSVEVSSCCFTPLRCTPLPTGIHVSLEWWLVAYEVGDQSCLSGSFTDLVVPLF